jgi:hypothetical protein
MIDNLRKKASLVGLFFFIASATVPFFDAGSDSPAVKSAIDPFVTPMLGGYTDVAVAILVIFYLIGNLVFYFMAWRNSKKVIWFFYLIYSLSLLIVLAEWGLEVQLGITEFLGTLACVADGIIFACVLISRNEQGRPK